VDWLEADRPVLQKTFPGSIGLLCGKDRIPVQHSAVYLAREGVGPALGAKTFGSIRGWVMALVATNGWGTTPPKRSCSPAMPSWAACSRLTKVLLGTK
jgi:hypothetical protein